MKQRDLSSTFQKTLQLYCGDEPSHYKIVRGEWPKIIFLRGLIPRRKVLDLSLLKFFTDYLFEGIDHFRVELFSAF